MGIGDGVRSGGPDSEMGKVIEINETHALIRWGNNQIAFNHLGIKKNKKGEFDIYA